MSIAIDAIATNPSVPSPRAAPPRTLAAAVSPAPRPARSTLVSGSTIARNAAATPIAASARMVADAPATRPTDATTVTSTATLKPLIASTWLMPAARKSEAGRDRPGRRMPVVIAETRAWSESRAHAGIERAMPSAAADRSQRSAASHGHRSSSGCSRPEDGTSITGSGGPSRAPGFLMVRGVRHQPRTSTRADRPGIGSRPETRTIASNGRGAHGSPSVLRTASTSNRKVRDASWMANAASASPPPSPTRGSERTVPRTRHGPSRGGPRDATTRASASVSATPAAAESSMIHRRVARTPHLALPQHPRTASESTATVAADTAKDETAPRRTSSMPACDPTPRSTISPVASADTNIAAAATNASGTGSFGSSSADASTPRRYGAAGRVPDSTPFFRRIDP